MEGRSFAAAQAAQKILIVVVRIDHMFAAAQAAQKSPARMA